MATPITDAIERYDERKTAVGVENQRLTEMDPVRALLSGFDLDLDELLALKPLLVTAAIRAGKGRVPIPPREILFGQWVDGLMTGLFLAEMRANEGDS